MIASNESQTMRSRNMANNGHEYNAELELAVLGSAMTADGSPEYIRCVQPEWFYEPSHRELWSIIQQTGFKPIAHIQEEIYRRGLSHLKPLIIHSINAAPTLSFQAREHISLLKEKSFRRELSAVSKKIGHAALHSSDFESLMELTSNASKLALQITTPIEARGRSLTELAFLTVDDEDSLLGNRFLSRGGVMLLVGPSGIGKSSASCQQDMCWCLGLEAFGFKPSQPLRVLTIQAENDDGDLHEMSTGVMRGLKLSRKEMDTIHSDTLYMTRFQTGNKFLHMLDAEIQAWKPDLVRIDPITAFVGDDLKKPDVVSNFCRSGITPIIKRYGCGCIINHHTTKTNYRNTSNWSSLDWSYAAAGSADLTNWARAVLNIEPIDSNQQVFKFHATKRGKRLGWLNDENEPTLEKFFKHTSEPGSIYWEPADSHEILAAKRSSSKAKPNPDDALALVPEFGTIEKKELQKKIQLNLNVGEKKARELIKHLIASKMVYVHSIKRSGVRNAPHIGRHKPDELTQE